MPIADSNTKEPAVTLASPNDDLASITGQIDGLVKGSAAVSAPAEAIEGEAFFVYLTVAPGRLQPLLEAMKAEYPDNGTAKGRESVGLTPRMSASVTGMGFHVSPTGEQMQAVSTTEPTTWMWQVMATESGTKTLTFNLSGALTVQKREVPRSFYVPPQKVKVIISSAGFVKENWKWLTSTVALPAIGALWALLRKRVDERGQRHPSVLETLRERRRTRAGRV